MGTMEITKIVWFQMESLKQHLLLQCNEAEDERKALQAKQMDLAKMLAAQQAEATEREQHVTWLTSRVSTRFILV